MQMLLAGHLPNPRDGVPHGAKWCADIESFATTNYVASEQKDRRSLQPLECSRETALWEFIMTCMLKVDPEVRLSAEQCLEAGRSTVFRYFGNLGVEGQRAPPPRQRAESSSVPTASEKGKAPMRIEKAKAPMRIEKAKAPMGVDKGKAPIRVDKGKAPIRVDKGKAPIRVARAADSEKAATRQDRPIRPLIAAKEVVNLEQYNSAASEVVYNPGVDETEVWKDQGSQGAATARPTAERAGNEPIPNDWRFLNLNDYWPSMDQHVDKGPAKEGFSDAQQFTAVHDAPGPSFLPNPATSEANTAQNQAPDLALIHQLRDNYGGALMNWMKS